MQFLTKLIRTVLFTTVGLSPLIAMAQDNTSLQTSQHSQQTIDISDADLAKFVEASKEIAKVREYYIAQLNEADQPQDAQSLQVEVQQKMIKAVNKAGIDAEMYNEIISQLQMDEKLRQRVEKMQ